MLAVVVVMVGFVVVFTTFITDSAWSWIIGGVMLVGGALWAGLASPTPVQPVTPVAATPVGAERERDHGSSA